MPLMSCSSINTKSNFTVHVIITTIINCFEKSNISNQFKLSYLFFCMKLVLMAVVLSWYGVRWWKNRCKIVCQRLMYILYYLVQCVGRTIAVWLTHLCNSMWAGRHKWIGPMLQCTRLTQLMVSWNMIFAAGAISSVNINRSQIQHQRKG